MPSVSPHRSENTAVRTVLRLLHEGGLDTAYRTAGLDPLPDDRHERHNAYALLAGTSAKTLVLLGHIDTVGFTDYGALEPWALDPEGLADRLGDLASLAHGLAEDVAEFPGDWMFGRGVADMKSGVAASIAVLRHCAQKDIPPPVSLLLIATPDEEYESAGVLHAVELLRRLQQEYGLDYVGAINTDYVTSEGAGTCDWYYYAGTAGKLLPSFYVVGRSSHVGDPDGGINAAYLAAQVAADLSLTDTLCDSTTGQSAPLPTVLHLADLKQGYDTQIPFTAWMYLNVLTLTTDPGALLTHLLTLTRDAMQRALGNLEQARTRRTGTHPDHSPSQAASVLSYHELFVATADLVGVERVENELAAEWAEWDAELDARERGLRAVQRLWALSRRQGPAIVLFYSPPYYPHIAPHASALHCAVDATAAAHPELHLVERQYFPLLSDMSYLRLDSDEGLGALTDNMPLWRDHGHSGHTGGYSLPLALMKELNLPVMNLGPFGRGAHEAGERVRMSLAFGALPMLLDETIHNPILLT